MIEKTTTFDDAETIRHSGRNGVASHHFGIIGS